MKSAVFANSYVALIFTFEDIILDYPDSCSAIFTADTLSLFGTVPRCSWELPVLTVDLG